MLVCTFGSSVAAAAPVGGLRSPPPHGHGARARFIRCAAASLPAASRLRLRMRLSPESVVDEPPFSGHACKGFIGAVRARRRVARVSLA